MADEQQKYDQYLTGKIITRNEDGGGGDFEEQQMWDSSMHETNSSAHYYHNSSSSSTTTSNKLQFGRPGGGSSTTKSAPMAIPDWQKIYGTAHEAAAPQHEEIFFKDDSDEGEMMIPPHEYIARKKLASSQLISSFSVCEGAGRTLKGRDLSRVRNAILTKTGFIE